MTAPVFVVERMPTGPEFVLDGPEGRHAVSVKRLQPGEDVVLTDGLGHWAEGVVRAAEGKDRLTVTGLDSIHEEPAPAPRITVVQALPKGDRGELAVETMTETGVDAIVPWQAARCITQWKGERGAKALSKWRSTAREAGKQSRRVRFPEVAAAMTTKQVAALLAAADFAGVLHEDRDHDSTPSPPPNSPPRADSCSSSAPREASPRRSWPPSPRRAPAPTVSAAACCAPPPPGRPRPRCCWDAPAAGDEPGGVRRTPAGAAGAPRAGAPRRCGVRR